MLGLDRQADTKERRGTFWVGHFLNLKGLKLNLFLDLCFYAQAPVEQHGVINYPASFRKHCI